jgi:predicted nucleic acid-binding protein
MLSPCLIDTNILIYALTNNATPAVLARIDMAIANQARYSVVTRMELLGWRGHTSDSRHKTKELLLQLTEIPLTPSIVAKVIDIRCELAIKLPDAIIAASALIEGLPLVTRNTTDFNRIAELQAIDPFVD